MIKYWRNLFPNINFIFAGRTFPEAETFLLYWNSTLSFLWFSIVVSFFLEQKQ